jgi:Uma2 family endonuclease
MSLAPAASESLAPTAAGEPVPALAASAFVPSEPDGFPSLRLPLDLRLSPEQFALVCAANPQAVLELAADGRLITMTPTGGETGVRNSLLLARLQIWALAQDGWKVFDSSSGFRLPDGSVLSPDAALVRLERWQALTPAERRGFPPLCPDLVVELASSSDGDPRATKALRQKMAVYIANGARLGWLLLPEERAVEIWQVGADLSAPVEPQRLEPALVLEGGEMLPGLRLELEEIWGV